MDALPKLKAFLATAETGTFSDAARQIGVSPSVIMKRVNELEFDFRAKLFSRSTRRVTLTDEGRLYLVPVQRIVKEFDELRSGAFRASSGLEGRIRVRAPIATTTHHLRQIFSDFQKQNPKVGLTVITSEWAGNPIADGFDIVIASDLMSYQGVAEERLCPVSRVVCASPLYLERRGTPREPHELKNHDILTFSPAGLGCWSFQTPSGPLSVDVHPMLGTDNPKYLCAAAADGRGIAMLATLTAASALENGSLVPILQDFPLSPRWMKLMVPESSLRLAPVQALRNLIRERFRQRQPIERAPAPRLKVRSDSKLASTPVA